MRPKYFSVPVTTSAAAYSAGDVVGGLMSIPTGQGAAQRVLKSLYIVDKANQGAQLVAHFFKSLPVGPYTDNAPLDWGGASSADCDLLVGSVEMLAATYKTFDSIAIANAAYSVGLWNEVPRTMPTDNTGVQTFPLMYFILTTTGTPTYAANSTTLRFAGSFLEDIR